MPQEPITHRVNFDATSTFPFATLHEDNQQRHLNLKIEPDGTGYLLTLQTGDQDLVAALDGNLKCRLPLTATELWGAVQECRNTWHTQVIDRRNANGDLLFQRYWDMREVPQYLETALRPLAEAGRDLFIAIFQPAADDGSPDRPVRQHIYDVLSTHTADRPLWIRVTSSQFFAPWNLIYCKPTRLSDEIDPRGFWGYQHVIEHIPYDRDIVPMDLDQPGTQPLYIGVNIDPDIDTDLDVACLSRVLDQLADYPDDALRQLQRKFKIDLRTAMETGVDDHMVYFCCHAEQEGDAAVIVGSPGRLRLGDEDDDGWIRPAEIRRWTDAKNLLHRPVVFLNACGSGQFNSVFYQGFGREFLAAGACSVIGPQTDLPAVFAGEFAHEFFERFFTGSVANKIGIVLADLRRQFFDDYRNPLGLLYSLYRGADMYLREPVRRTALSPSA